MNILVTGASGFLGRHVVAELVQRGHSVSGMVRPASDVAALEGKLPGVKWVKADLRTGRGLDVAMAGIEVVVHLAAAVTGDEEAQFASTAVGTERLLAAMVEARVEKLVLASSFSVYDYRKIDSRNGVLDEESPVEIGRALYERDGYAVAKVWQERICRRWAEGSRDRKLAVLRPGFIWGREHWDLAGIGQRVGGWQLVFGARRELPITHVENCAMAFALAAEKPQGWGQTFNVVDEHGVSAWEYVGVCARRAGMEVRRLPVAYGVAHGLTRMVMGVSRWMLGARAKLPSILAPRRFEARFWPVRVRARLAHEVLGWRPRLGWEDAVEATFGGEGGGDVSAPSPPEGGPGAAWSGGDSSGRAE